MTFQTKLLAELKGRWEFSVCLEHREIPHHLLAFSHLCDVLQVLQCGRTAWQPGEDKQNRIVRESQVEGVGKRQAKSWG